MSRVHVLKWRHKFAGGTDDWQFIVIDGKPSKEELEEMVDSLRSEYDWSDLYRGVEHLVVAWDELEAGERNKVRRTMLTTVRNLRSSLALNVELRKLLGGLEAEPKTTPVKPIAIISKDDAGKVICSKVGELR